MRRRLGIGPIHQVFIQEVNQTIWANLWARLSWFDKEQWARRAKALIALPVLRLLSSWLDTC
jgi:hypothetical protein